MTGYELTEDMKKEFLAIQNIDEYMAFITKFPVPAIQFAQDEKTKKKMEEIAGWGEPDDSLEAGHYDLKKKEAHKKR